MNIPLVITVLLLEAITLFLLVLGTHSLRHKYGMGYFYALLGAVTAVMSWVTEVGVNVELYGITFFIGSTVFYTSLLLGVFIVYVFDGPVATRRIIAVVMGVSILIPVVLASLDYQMNTLGFGGSDMIPVPELRINTASVVATFLDLLFLAIAWEFLGNPKLKIPTWLRSYLTLLGVMWLDIVLFATGAFAGTDSYFTIMQGSFSSRLVISLIAFPFLWSYMSWENSHKALDVEARPALSIIQHAAEVEEELSLAQKEIRERKRAETDLRESELRFRGLFENMFEGGYQTTPEGHILSANPALLKMLGYDSREELQEKVNAKDVYMDPAHRENLLETLVGEGELRGVEVAMKHRDGKEIFVLENSQAIHDTSGKVVRFDGTLTDITAHKQAEKEKQLLEAQLRQSQKLESLGTLAGGVAHEINNPLMGVINYAQLINDGAQGQELKEYSQGILEEGNRIAGIVQSLLSFARQDSPQDSLTQPGDILESALSLLKSSLRKDQIHLEQDIPKDLPLLRCRSHQILQVLVNLLTNARDALNQRYPRYHENKKLIIRVRSVEQDGKTLLRTTVTDHGSGIPAEDLEKIFDPFFTTKPRDVSTGKFGTGLGLSVSFGIVRDHQGLLWAESVPGEYTRLHMDLPVENEEAQDQ